MLRETPSKVCMVLPSLTRIFAPAAAAPPRDEEEEEAAAPLLDERAA